jgi:hypothetical protein
VPRPGDTRAATPTPSNFPRVDKDTQKSRDDGRRRILEDELTTEEKGLSDARAKLSEQEAVRYADEKNYQRVLDRLKPYQDVIGTSGTSPPSPELAVAVSSRRRQARITPGGG